jgi:hypothetical protein
MLQQEQLFGRGTENGTPSTASDFSIPTVSEEFPESSVRSPGSAPQVLGQWKKGIFKEMPQVAVLRPRIARCAEQPSRINRRLQASGARS